MTLTDDEIAVFYAIFTCAERVDWACYDAFRLRILAEGAEQTAPPLEADTPALNDAGSPSHLPPAPFPDRGGLVSLTEMPKILWKLTKSLEARQPPH